MRKKQEEYIPQFNYDDFPTTKTPEREVLKCEKCGKYSVSLHNGLCFECRQEEPSSDTLKEMLEKEKKRKDKAKLIFEITLFSISAILWILILLNIIPLESPLGEAIARGAMIGFVGSLLIFLIEAICKIIKLLGSFFKKTGSFLKKTSSSLKESTNKKIKEYKSKKTMLLSTKYPLLMKSKSLKNFWIWAPLLKKSLTQRKSNY